MHTEPEGPAVVTSNTALTNRKEGDMSNPTCDLCNKTTYPGVRIGDAFCCFACGPQLAEDVRQALDEAGVFTRVVIRQQFTAVFEVIKPGSPVILTLTNDDRHGDNERRWWDVYDAQGMRHWSTAYMSEDSLPTLHALLDAAVPGPVYTRAQWHEICEAVEVREWDDIDAARLGPIAEALIDARDHFDQDDAQVWATIEAAGQRWQAWTVEQFRRLVRASSGHHDDDLP
jgi:hypothetical protein